MFRPTIGYSLFSQSPFDGHLFPVFFPTSNKASFSKQFAASRSVCFSLGRALGRMALCIGDWCPVAPLRSCLRLHLDLRCDPAGVSPAACLMWKSVMADGREEPGCVPCPSFYCQIYSIGKYRGFLVVRAQDLKETRLRGSSMWSNKSRKIMTTLTFLPRQAARRPMSDVPSLGLWCVRRRWER